MPMGNLKQGFVKPRMLVQRRWNNLCTAQRDGVGCFRAFEISGVVEIFSLRVIFPEAVMHDFLLSLNLTDIRIFLTSGHPPVLFQVLAINTIIMMMIIFRRGHGKGSMRRHVSYVLQWILILGNLAVFCQEQWMPYYQEGESLMVNHVSHMLRPY